MALRDRIDFVRNSKDLTLGMLMERLASVYGDRRLVEESNDGLTLNYEEAADLVARLAQGIAEETKPGDRVVIATPNGYGLFLACLAACRAGSIAVPANPKMRDDEIEHVIADSGAALVVRDIKEIEADTAIPADAPVDPRDVAVLFYTSGT